jgi:hypothetical protein
MLSSKEGEKWGSSGPKVVSNMRSVEWDTCIHIVRFNHFPRRGEGENHFWIGDATMSHTRWY